MVATRRTKKTESPAKESSNDTPAKDTTVAAESSRPSSSKKSRKNRKEELKSKITGVGLSISIDGNQKENKKIIFEKDQLVEEEIDEVEKERREIKSSDKNSFSVPVKDQASDDENGVYDDDDDAVEEVKGSAARDEILQQMEAEEKGVVKSKKKKKRRERKQQDDSDSDDDEDLDDDFFAQLETVKKGEGESKKAKERKNQKKGKHTTFIFDESNEGSHDFSNPKKVGHNIQVVVLPDQEETVGEDAITAVPTTALTQDALLYSRNILEDGSDKGKKRKKKSSPNLPDTSWKRSRKMNLVMTTKSAKFNRRGGRGRPAANFATKVNK